MGGGGHKLQIDDVFLGGGGHSKVDMGRYEGGRGLKWPKIGDVVYGWPLIGIGLFLVNIKTSINKMNEN